MNKKIDKKISKAASTMGKKGGAKTASKGSDHFRNLQKKGVRIRKAKKKNKSTEIFA